MGEGGERENGDASPKAAGVVESTKTVEDGHKKLQLNQTKLDLNGFLYTRT